MNKKIIAALVAVTLAGSSLVACGMQGKTGHHDRFQKNVMLLDLSNEQRDKIEAIYEKADANEAHPLDALSEKEFDKAKFIKIAKEKRENKILQKADLIADVYALLTPEQKKQLHVVLNLKSSMMYNKACGSEKKVCDGHKKGCESQKKVCESHKSRTCDK